LIGEVTSFPPYLVRFYEPADVEALRSFRCEIQGERYTRDVERLIREAPELLESADPPAYVAALVAIHAEDGLVGAILYGIESATDSTSVAVIYSLGVVEGHRRRGIGTRLKMVAVVDLLLYGHDGPVTSIVHRRNYRMINLNASRFDAAQAPDPEDGDYLVASVRVLRPGAADSIAISDAAT
jgi:GNAT superfamily N-acetyltransferase